jgi:hypothetical protein
MAAGALPGTCWPTATPVADLEVADLRRDYGRDVLSEGWRKPRRPPPPEVEAQRGLVVETRDGAFCGAVVRCDKADVTLEDRFGNERVFPLERGGFLLEGQRVTLIRPAAAGPGGAGPGGAGGGPGAGGVRPGRTASGSIAPPVSRAKVAQASRIYVEGKHDAELVEKIWGDDLRDVGVVVEYLEGVDHLEAEVAGFGPGPGRRLGVLVDHLVDGSKESRIAAGVSSPYVLVTGHPFIDIWQAVKPASVGIRAWPDVPRGVPWKEGVLRALGWPCGGAADTALAWRRILRAARSYTDLEPALLGTVEHLIDFVTGPDDLHPGSG